MENPQPNQTRNLPQIGELKYIFTKKLTYGDLNQALRLTRSTTDYSYEFTESIFEDGLLVKLYTPAADYVVMQRFREKYKLYYRLTKQIQCEDNGIAHVNGFSTSDQIDCWCVYNLEGAKGEVISLLIQRVTAINMYIHIMFT